jgi:hypothetical protein
VSGCHCSDGRSGQWRDARTPARLGRSRPCQPRGSRPTWERLESQLKWDNRSSSTGQCWHERLKLLELAVAGALPSVAGVRSPVWVTGGLVAVLVVLEGARHLYRLQPAL